MFAEILKSTLPHIYEASAKPPLHRLVTCVIALSGNSIGVLSVSEMFKGTLPHVYGTWAKQYGKIFKVRHKVYSRVCGVVSLEVLRGSSTHGFVLQLYSSVSGTFLLEGLWAG